MSKPRANDPPELLPLGLLLRRGLRRRCPRCGDGQLFRRWASLAEDCSSCGLPFEKKPGDIWAFWVLIERLFLGLVLLVIVLGFRSRTWIHLTAFSTIVVSLFFATLPHRLGMCIALDYFSRRWTDPG